MPDFYTAGEYDLAGFIVGLVDHEKVINGSTIKLGDVCIGLASNGLHTNGYTLARKAAFELGGLKIGDHVAELGTTIDDALMRVHTCYANIVHELVSKFDIHGMAHITGGGLTGNLNRVLPENCDAKIRKGSWPVLPIFKLLKQLGDLDADDMYRAFNMGVGYVIVLPSDQADSLVTAVNKTDYRAYPIGEIISGSGQVRLVD
jgi:phosphoribosylformylglycinamidine cyclo-ligase